MPYSSMLRPVKQRRLSREEKARETYMRILEAAAQVVGEEGYAEASVSKITRLAGVAQGTFYNYLESRQHIFDKLRSEEHTSELQSLMRISYAVFCLKKKTKKKKNK